MLIVRGEWDSLCDDTDAAWLRRGLVTAASTTDVVIEKATHLMHLERGRHELHRVSADYLSRERA